VVPATNLLPCVGQPSILMLKRCGREQSRSRDEQRTTSKVGMETIRRTCTRVGRTPLVRVQNFHLRRHSGHESVGKSPKGILLSETANRAKPLKLHYDERTTRTTCRADYREAHRADHETVRCLLAGNVQLLQGLCGPVEYLDW
jgi:hypothetical protein